MADKNTKDAKSLDIIAIDRKSADEQEKVIMTNEVKKVFVDGIQSIGSHNGVHRIVFFALVGDGRQNEPVLELLMPANTVRSIADALSKLGR